jgi:hypothetical protein
MEDSQDLIGVGMAIGQHNAFGLIAGRCSAAQAETLRRVREEKQYLKCSAKWEEFCPRYLGMSYSQADRIIRLLEEFGPNYFKLSQLTRISADVYRAIEPAVKDGRIECNGEIIELAPENVRQVSAAVAELRRESSAKKAPPDRLEEVDRRFDAVMKELREAASGTDPGRLAETLRSMIQRLGTVVLDYRV